MPSSRIFVSYACIGDEPGAKVAKQLVDDIRATQTEAVTDHEAISDERFMEFLNRELPQCGYLIVIQTPVALQSLRVHATVNLALALVAQQRMRGILRILANTSPNASNQSLWETFYTFDASHDYLRAREGVFIKLGLTSLDADDSFYISRPLSLSTPQPSGQFPAPNSTNWPQPANHMAQPGTTNWPQPQPSGQFPAPNSTNWPQPANHMAQPGGTNWPQPQPSGQFPAPNSTNWPQPPSPSQMPRPAVPAHFPDAPVVQEKNQPVLLALKNMWYNISAPFKQFGKTSQTSIAAQPPNKAGILEDDHPMPLDTSRRTMLRWAIGLGIGLILILAIILFINSMHIAHPPSPPIKTSIAAFHHS